MNAVLPAETLALVVYWRSQDVFGRTNEFILSCAILGACLVPAGIILGALAGAIGGVLYLGSDDFLIWIFRGVPKIELVSITDADADVLVQFDLRPEVLPPLGRRPVDVAPGPPAACRSLCRRHRDPQADHCRAVVPAPVPGDQPARRILKAVDVRSGEMLGYLELHTFGPARCAAMIQLPLIDPAASERGRLAVQMLRSAATHAFSRMGTDPRSGLPQWPISRNLPNVAKRRGWASNTTSCGTKSTSWPDSTTPAQYPSPDYSWLPEGDTPAAMKPYGANLQWRQDFRTWSPRSSGDRAMDF